MKTSFYYYWSFSWRLIVIFYRRRNLQPYIIFYYPALSMYYFLQLCFVHLLLFFVFFFTFALFYSHIALDLPPASQKWSTSTLRRGQVKGVYLRRLLSFSVKLHFCVCQKHSSLPSRATKKLLVIGSTKSCASHRPSIYIQGAATIFPPALLLS